MSSDPTHKLILKEKMDCGKHMFHLVFDADQEILDSYQQPGQYLVLTNGDNSSFFAISSPTRHKEIEILVKQGGEVADYLCQLKCGDSVWASTAQGKGYQVDCVLGRDIHFFCMGSGISPIRALIKTIIADGHQPRSMTLWQGCFSADFLPFAKEMESWEKVGLRIYRCYDRDEHSAFFGNVWDIARQKKLDLQASVVYSCGSSLFQEQGLETCTQLGLVVEKFLSNY